MDDAQTFRRIDHLIEKPETFMPSFSHQADSSRFDEAAPFIGWKVQTMTFLTELLGAEHPYVQQFAAHVTNPFVRDAKAGQSILRAIREDLKNAYLAPSCPGDSINALT